MNWSAVKNLLIGILLAANLFLIYNIVRQDRTREYIDDEEVFGAAELLSERGLAVDPSCVPLEKFSAPVYESSYSDEYYTRSAEAMCASPRELLLSLPEGGFSITAENGASAEFDTEFGFVYMKNGNSVSLAYNEVTAENFASEAELFGDVSSSRLNVLTKDAESFLEIGVGNDYALRAEVTDGYYDDEKGLTYLFAKQLAYDYEIYSHYAVCVYKDDELVYAAGRWYFAPFDEEYRTELIDQVNILFYDLSTIRSYEAAPYAVADISEDVAEVGHTVNTDTDGTVSATVESMKP